MLYEIGRCCIMIGASALLLACAYWVIRQAKGSG